MKDFTPMLIGVPDAGRIKALTNLYDDICTELSGLQAYLQIMFTEETKFCNTDFISELLKSDPELFIRKAWIDHKEIKLPGIDLEKLIHNDLLDIPKYDEIIDCVDSLKKLFNESKFLKFNFPLEKLMNAEGCFILTEEFSEKLNETNHIFTENEQQNEVLEAVTELKNAINKICNLGLIPAKNLSQISFKFDRHVLKRTNRDPDPFELNPNMFNTTLRNLPKRK